MPQQLNHAWCMPQYGPSKVRIVETITWYDIIILFMKGFITMHS